MDTSNPEEPTGAPQPDWTREMIRAWVDKATEDYQHSLRAAPVGAGTSIMDYIKGNQIDYFSAIVDESTPKAIVRGDILMAIFRFENETGLKVLSVNVSGVSVKLTL